ncbi:MAG: hypothetical protein LBM66_07680, partial [Bifidobacteriaceae bacterium]|nr:hypothetical protein [Bifidobacteriaceae bacterium]
AYMVLTHMPDDAKLTVDDRDTSVVDVIIGAKYNGIRPASEVAVSAGDRIAPAPGCVPLTQAMADIGVSIAPSPSPSAATKKTKKSGTATPTAPSTGY